MAPSRPVLQEFACIASAPLTYLAPLEKALDHRRGPKPNGLSCSASRVAGENGPAVRRACGHAALPRRCAVGPGLPVSRARRRWPRLRPSLWSVLRCKTIPPLRPPACPAPPLACSRRANLASKHTHMSMEAYPPDGPQISPPQGSQNFSARVVGVAGSVLRVRLCVL